MCKSSDPHSRRRYFLALKCHHVLQFCCRGKNHACQFRRRVEKASVIAASSCERSYSTLIGLRLLFEPPLTQWATRGNDPSTASRPNVIMTQWPTSATTQEQFVAQWRGDSRVNMGTDPRTVWQKRKVWFLLLEHLVVLPVLSLGPPGLRRWVPCCCLMAWGFSFSVFPFRFSYT